MKELEQEDPIIEAQKVTTPTVDEDECVMCKFVLIFALVGVFLVIVFTYFFKLHTPPSIAPLPEEEVRPVSDAEWQLRISELKRTANGERPATSTRP